MYQYSSQLSHLPSWIEQATPNFQLHSAHGRKTPNRHGILPPCPPEPIISVHIIISKVEEQWMGVIAEIQKNNAK